MPATPSNVKAAVSRMAAEEPSPPSRAQPGEDVASTAAQYRTNYVDVLRLVLGVGKGTMSANLSDTPDTMHFLTDGRPTAGDITDPEILLQWFEERNQFARVKVSVITFGQLVADRVLERARAARVPRRRSDAAGTCRGAPRARGVAHGAVPAR